MQQVAKVACSIDPAVLARLDHYVAAHVFKNRSQAIQQAIIETLEKLEKIQLAEACAQLDPAEEQRLADEGLIEDESAWPEY